MKHSKLIPASIVLVIVLVTLAVAGVAYGQADTTNQPENQNTGANGGQSPEALTVLPNGRISYQGRLLQNNLPVNATINITFRLYTVSTGGSAFWSETQSVVVKDGLFSVYLGAVTPLDDRAVTFQSQVYLGVQPAGAASELTPRQQLGAAAYAFNLMPGATIVDTNAAGGYSYSLWVSTTNHLGIYGASDTADGINGFSYAADQTGVYGANTSGGLTSHGVEGRGGGTATGTCDGMNCNAGVYARGTTDAYGVHAYSDNRSGILARNNTSGYYTGFFYNAQGSTAASLGTNGTAYFGGYVTFGAGKSGYVVDIAYNDGLEALEQGDVVVISGFDKPVVGDVPVIKVQKATSAADSGVVGVVDVRYTPCASPQPSADGQACGTFDTAVTTIQPGEYLSIVTLGAYQAVKVSAINGPIQPGDLLTTSGAQGGVAAKAEAVSVGDASFILPGTTFGKALGSLDTGTGVIPVFVTIR
jgi:hypothetical protein